MWHFGHLIKQYTAFNAFCNTTLIAVPVPAMMFIVKFYLKKKMWRNFAISELRELFLPYRDRISRSFWKGGQERNKIPLLLHHPSLALRCIMLYIFLRYLTFFFISVDLSTPWGQHTDTETFFSSNLCWGVNLTEKCFTQLNLFPC